MTTLTAEGISFLRPTVEPTPLITPPTHKTSSLRVHQILNEKNCFETYKNIYEKCLICKETNILCTKCKNIIACQEHFKYVVDENYKFIDKWSLHSPMELIIKNDSENEKKCQDILMKIKNENLIGFMREYALRLNDGKIIRGDFFIVFHNYTMMIWNGLHICMIVEVDGKQHLKDNNSSFCNREPGEKNTIAIDIAKTRYALDNGYLMVRIVDDDVEDTPYHMYKAIELGKRLYLSNPSLYPWLEKEFEGSYNTERYTPKNKSK